MDEAMHPLTILAVGLYGEVHAEAGRRADPARSCRGSTASRAPSRSSGSASSSGSRSTRWQESAPQEYGFYSNVNPTVDHPRWSQATERRIGEFFRRKTLMFNGYARPGGRDCTPGMDLKKNY